MYWYACFYHKLAWGIDFIMCVQFILQNMYVEKRENSKQHHKTVTITVDWTSTLTSSLA